MESINLNCQLSLPLIAAPMFLVSGPELVIECCRSGIIGTFPSINQRTSEGFKNWLIQIDAALKKEPNETPYGVNLIVHKTNPRFEADLELCVQYQVPLVITSLGTAKNVVSAVHSYGGKVFHDVISKKQAQKAADSGVDGLIAVSAGAGGHAGTISPFALIAEIREFFDKYLVLAGGLSRGDDILAARAAGADFAYMGTRFIATQESMASRPYKQMITELSSSDIYYTDKVSGISANFMKPSLEKANLLKPTEETPKLNLSEETKAWKHIWSAGHGVGAIRNIPKCAELVAQLKKEYEFGKTRILN